MDTHKYDAVRTWLCVVTYECSFMLTCVAGPAHVGRTVEAVHAGQCHAAVYQQTGIEQDKMIRPVQGGTLPTMEPYTHRMWWPNATCHLSPRGSCRTPFVGVRC